MPDDIKSVWPLHQLIFTGYVTWMELDTTMSLDDAQLLGMSIDFIEDTRAARERGRKLKETAETVKELADKRTPRRKSARIARQDGRSA